MLLSNQEITEEIKEETKKYLETNDKHDKPKPNGDSKSSFKREVYSNTILPQKTRNISNNLTLHLKQLEKEQKNPTVSRRREIIKIRSEINEKGIKEIGRASCRERV